MTAVFARYPEGGGEMLLALSLADHAADDGSRVYPSVRALAEKTRQATRTVQRQLRKMVDCGWLVVAGDAGGGRGHTTQYCVSAQWLAGGEPVPLVVAEGPRNDAFEPPAESTSSRLKGDKLAPFSETERVTSEALKGDIAVSPAYTTRRTITTPQPPKGASPLLGKSVKPNALTGQAEAGLKTLGAWLAECTANGVRPIPPDDPVFAYCATVGVGMDVLALHWWQFKRKRLDSRKRQRSWRQAFRNSVEGNWFRLWFLKPGMDAQLTTQGLQAQAAMLAEQADAHGASLASVDGGAA